MSTSVCPKCGARFYAFGTNEANDLIGHCRNCGQITFRDELYIGARPAGGP